MVQRTPILNFFSHLILIVGVIVALETRATPLLLWGPLLATLTGCGGGIIRCRTFPCQLHTHGD